MSSPASLPSARNSTSSAVAATCGSWVTSTSVWESRRAASRSTPSTRSPVRRSSAPVGSSAKTTVGRVMSARAIATRWAWPPDSSLGRRSAIPSSPTESIKSCCHRSSGRRPSSSIGNWMFSPTVRWLMRLYAWKTKPMWRRRKRVTASGDSSVMSVPPMITWPLVGVSSPAARFRNVDLPEPDGPMIAVNAPGSMSSEMPWSAATGSGPLG
ncbi:hypothetical protein RS85_03614 [Microbacterium sp. SA39]|nr:hypothetical protein RS85_03614 [Microbacterium sp. SA39]